MYIYLIKQLLNLSSLNLDNFTRFITYSISLFYLQIVKNVSFSNQYLYCYNIFKFKNSNC